MRKVSRRQFLMGVAAIGAVPLLAACQQPAAPAPTSAPGATSAPKPAGTTAPAATSAPKVSTGQTVRIMGGTSAYDMALSGTLNKEFTAQTGINVQMETLTDPILLQRSELELSSGGSSYDVIRMFFIKTGHFIGAGWCSPLDAYIARDAKEVDVSDFPTYAFQVGQANGHTYSLPWGADVQLLAYRKDVLDKFGVTNAPNTFDDLKSVCAKINTKELAAIVMRGAPQASAAAWIYPAFLQAYGGNVFADPPTDLTPTLNTQSAIDSAVMFTTLLRDYSVPGVGNFIYDDIVTAMSQGKAAMNIDGTFALGAMMDPTKNPQAANMWFAEVPKGPQARRPQMAVHGWLIPVGAKNKDLSWEWIKWAVSKSVIKEVALDFPYPPVVRQSVLLDADYLKKYNWAGGKFGQLVLDSIPLTRIAYRYVNEFLPVGDRLGVALSQILSNQMKPKDALDAAQKDAVDILTRAGVKVHS